MDDYGDWVVRVEACNDASCGKPLSKRFQVEPAPEPTATPAPTATPTPEPTAEPTPEPTPEPVPARPDEVKVATEAGSLDVSADWNDVDDADTYRVRWRVAGAGQKLNAGVVVDVSAARFTVADYGDWVVRLEACNDSGCGPYLARRFEVRPPPNRAPVVNEDAERYDEFIESLNAPRGIIVYKGFEGIFTDPDGDELTYSVTVPADREDLMDLVSIQETKDYVGIRLDSEDDWAAVSPVMADPLASAVTLTATDPDGLSASVTGYFDTYWGVHYSLAGIRFDDPAEPASVPPAQPKNLVIEANPSELDLTASWDHAEWASIYRVRWRLAGDDFASKDEARVIATEAAFTVSGFGVWEVQVEGCNSAGCGLASQMQLAVEPQPVGPGYRGQLGEVLVELSLRRPSLPPAPVRAPRNTKGVSAQSSHTTSIVYVIDDSSSMDGDFPEVRTALEDVRGATMADTKVALIGFGTDPITVFGLTDHSTSATTGPWTDARINAFGGKLGSTNYKKPLEAAKALLDADTVATTKKIIFLTDAQLPRPTAVVQAIVDAGIIVDTIGFGDHYSDNFSVLRQIAADTGGAYRAVQKPSQGTTNTPAVTATLLSDILKGTVADDTATLFLVDYSFSVYPGNEGVLHPALTAAATKAGESSGNDRQVGLAVFLGETILSQNPPQNPPIGFQSVLYQKYHVVNTIGSSSLGMDDGTSVFYFPYLSGSTDIEYALQQAYSTITASSVTATNKRVVLITDGISATDVQTPTLNSYKNDTTVNLDVVAWGAHADRVQLKTWAESASGNFSVAKAGPTAPKGFTAAVGYDRTLALSWNDPSDSTITKYQYRYLLGITGRMSEWMDFPGAGADTTLHVFTGVSRYQKSIRPGPVQIRAAYGVYLPGASSYDLILSYSAYASYGIHLNATAGDGQIALSWNDPSDSSITKYQYARRKGNGGWTSWTDIPGSSATTTSHTITGLTNRTAYTIAVRAVRSDADDLLSSVSATPTN